jgi:hypothetical protein
MWILKSLNRPIPGNYYYVQTEPYFKTPANPLVEEPAKSLSSFRIANKLPRASLAESLEDVIFFTCARLQNNESYCFDCDHSFETHYAAHHFIKKNCASCGIALAKD